MYILIRRLAEVDLDVKGPLRVLGRPLLHNFAIMNYVTRSVRLTSVYDHRRHRSIRGSTLFSFC